MVKMMRNHVIGKNILLFIIKQLQREDASIKPNNPTMIEITDYAHIMQRKDISIRPNDPNMVQITDYTPCVILMKDQNGALLGRGAPINKHVGNINFSNIVRYYKENILLQGITMRNT